jgi:hypothetical protein
MSADDNSWIGVWEQLQAGQEVVGGGSEGVLVSSPVQLFTHELFGRGVGNGAHGHVGRGDAAAVIEWSGNTEVGEENPPIIAVEIGDDDVGGLDVSVQQAPLVGIVQRAGDSGNDGG